MKIASSLAVLALTAAMAIPPVTVAQAVDAHHPEKSAASKSAAGAKKATPLRKKQVKVPRVRDGAK